MENKILENKIFKGGLPELPLIVALAHELPDSVNNLVWKFVGCESKAMKELKITIANIKNDQRLVRVLGDDWSRHLLYKVCLRNERLMNRIRGFHDIKNYFFELCKRFGDDENLEILTLRLYRLPWEVQRHITCGGHDGCNKFIDRMYAGFHLENWHLCYLNKVY